MLRFLARRVLTMLVTALCLTFVVFWLTNLAPNLEKIARSEVGTRISEAEVASWLDRNGYAGPLGPASAGAMADYVLVDMFAEAVTGQRSTEEAIANAERRLQRYYR